MNRQHLLSALGVHPPISNVMPRIRVSVGFCVVVAISALLGCAAVGPDYVPPKTPVPDSWHTQLHGGLVHEEAEPEKLATWWTVLNDPDLIRLVKRSASGNLDLKQAKARLREARARRLLVGADQYPALDANAAATRSHGSEAGGTDKTRTLYTIGFDAAWEIDVFGGVRRSVEAAEADFMASGEDLHDVMVSLMAETALNYVELRSLQARLATARMNLKNQQQTYRLTQWRFKAGLSDELDVSQARSSLESTRARIPNLRISINEAKNRLAVLVGVPPGALHEDLQASRPVPMVPLKVAVGLPADILRQRPDIRKAERELAAQTARVGVAAADQYPKFTLNGSLGFAALSTADLLSAAHRSDSYGPRISWRIFDAGAVRRNIEVQSAKQEQALAAYELTVLKALEESENALNAYAEEQQRRDFLVAAVQAARQAFDMAHFKYQSGLIDFMTLLDAQRSLLASEDELNVSNGTVTSNLVRLYKALGGGWNIRTSANNPEAS